VKQNDQPYLRGFGFENYTSRADWTRGYNAAGIGAEWKENMTRPGEWFAYFEAYGETLPEHNNTVKLSEDKKDKWGFTVAEDINGVWRK
jgi:hypothetical protein